MNDESKKSLAYRYAKRMCRQNKNVGYKSLYLVFTATFAIAVMKFSQYYLGEVSLTEAFFMSFTLLLLSFGTLERIGMREILEEKNIKSE